MKALERKLAVAVKRAEAVEKRTQVATGRTKVVPTPASTDNHGDDNHDDVDRYRLFVHFCNDDLFRHGQLLRCRRLLSFRPHHLLIDAEDKRALVSLTGSRRHINFNYYITFEYSLCVDHI